MSRSSSFTMRLDPNSKADSTSLRRWVIAFCIIRFDLEQGQVIEECFPPGALSSQEELESALSSFPDSMSQYQNRSSITDCMFFFRFPCRGSSRRESKPNSEMQDLGHTLAIGSQSRYIYGYVFNRQRQDERLKRGGEQKSVVILSHSPYSSVFKPLLQILGPLCFDIGKKALEHVASYVAAWPFPVLGKLMELPIGNATMKVYLPPAYSFLSEGGAFLEEFVHMMTPFPPANPSIPQGLFHDSDIFGIFRGLLLQLWMLWELLIIGEPLLIIAPTASQCSEAVATLVSLVAPLPLSVDFRPYFTIHDPDFARLNSLSAGDPFPPMILRVTNLFFLKALRNISNIVSVGSPSSNSTRLSQAPKSASLGRIVGPDQLNFQQFALKKLSPSNLLNAVKMRRDGPLCLMTEHKEAIWSSYSAITKADTAILNRLIDAGIPGRIEESVSVVNNEILRRHFLELTTNFLAPFGPYLRATTPSEGVSPFLDPPSLPLFDASEFIESLSARGPGKFLSKRMKGNWLDLYRRFLNGENFMPWFQKRRAMAEQEQQRLWRQARMRTDIRHVISKMSELEIVDSFNAIERHLLVEIQSGVGNVESASACKKLKSDLQTVFNVLPKDMQELLLFNPQKASLLRGSFELAKFPGRPDALVETVSETEFSKRCRNMEMLAYVRKLTAWKDPLHS